ncbi:MAG: PLD nuclease N-terminal domain-containing protein [Candidatus Woesearchaeota archaeon]
MAAEVFIGIGIILLILFCFALFLAMFALWIWMIIDCAQRKFKSDSEKVVWILVIVLLGWLGAIIYYFVVKRKK